MVIKLTMADTVAMVMTSQRLWGAAGTCDVLAKDQDEGDNFQEEDDRMEVFSRRKLESNWDRYEESERQEPDDGTPAKRGADYHVLLESAADKMPQLHIFNNIPAGCV
ncbi:hypothetical protein L3Q82_001290 [Scortum barcoo]|uniref:Uncharacterized protein n=1 Tax=Scortum barcoo TaxID=214431 RepID=A0ACB8W7Q9_9TELE|nr:hypothetical protein L3Q82_001290 [Scortum barcoo]